MFALTVSSIFALTSPGGPPFPFWPPFFWTPCACSKWDSPGPVAIVVKVTALATNPNDRSAVDLVISIILEDSPIGGVMRLAPEEVDTQLFLFEKFDRNAIRTTARLRQPGEHHPMDDA